MPTKGADLAIKVALETGENLIIAGTPNKGRYWEEKIKPYLGKNIKYVGNISYEKTYKYYGQSKATLCPIRWEEPFGLTFIESMACGTPVIALDRGSAREVIQDGKTGFVVKNIRGMIKAIKKIGEIKREDCRALVEKRFTTERMVSDYEKIYQEILAR